MRTYEECKRIITAVIDGENPNWYRTLKGRRTTGIRMSLKKCLDKVEELPLFEIKSAGTYLSNKSDEVRYQQALKELEICVN